MIIKDLTKQDLEVLGRVLDTALKTGGLQALDDVNIINAAVKQGMEKPDAVTK